MTATIECDDNGHAKRIVRYDRRSIELSEHQWAHLERLAKRLRCKARGGSRTGKPSWRTLIGQIAEGALCVTWRREPSREAA
jgi:hypothetical protein